MKSCYRYHVGVYFKIGNSRFLLVISKTKSQSLRQTRAPHGAVALVGLDSNIRNPFRRNRHHGLKWNPVTRSHPTLSIPSRWEEVKGDTKLLMMPC